MNILTVQQLKNMNCIVTRNPRDVVYERILASVIDEVFYKENISFYRYRFIADKAAALGCEIMRKVPFANENTRTAIVAMMTLLNINEIKFTDNYQEDISALIDAISGDSAYSNTLDWINSHIKGNYYYNPIG